MRDDFAEQTKRALALRVGYRCSRPECAALTAGPQDDESKAINVGVAAHITAASQHGPRFDPLLTPDERVATANGIWLCQNCAKLIDSDIAQFPIEVLQRWKIDREAEARRQIGRAAAEESARDLIVELCLGEFVESGVSRTPKFFFKVANPNLRPVTLWGAGIEAPEVGISAPVLVPQLLVFPPQLAFPREITDGQGFAFLGAIDYFESELRAKRIVPPVQVIGYVTDALGNRHESKPTTYSRSSNASN